MKVNLNDYSYDYGTAVSRPTASEFGRTFILDNKSKYIAKKWAIDKVVFRGKINERCDYLIEIDGNRYYWVELKGKDLKKACCQLLNTLEIVDTSNAKIQEARIITTKTNKIDIRTIEYQKLDKLMGKTGGRLKTYTNQGSETI